MLQLSRPGAGPAAELPRAAQASRCHAARKRVESNAASGVPLRLRRAGLAAQLSIRAVRLTQGDVP